MEQTREGVIQEFGIVAGCEAWDDYLMLYDQFKEIPLVKEKQEDIEMCINEALNGIEPDIKVDLED